MRRESSRPWTETTHRLEKCPPSNWDLDSPMFPPSCTTIEVMSLTIPGRSAPTGEMLDWAVSEQSNDTVPTNISRTVRPSYLC